MKFGIIGSGSWATALTKILTDKNHSVNWWIRNEITIKHIRQRRHNPHYLSSVFFDVSLLDISTDIKKVMDHSDTIVIGVPSAFIEETIKYLHADDWKDKKIVSAIKGLLPQKDILLNYYLQQQFAVP